MRLKWMIHPLCIVSLPPFNFISFLLIYYFLMYYLLYLSIPPLFFFVHPLQLLHLLHFSCIPSFDECTKMFSVDTQITEVLNGS